MAFDLENWKTQIRKGYLELCILTLISREGQIYGFEILSQMEKFEMPLKEGTLYPLLNRMTEDGVLAAKWETQGPKGHPRKFYSLTAAGKKLLWGMSEEFERMVSVTQNLSKNERRKKNDEIHTA